MWETEGLVPAALTAQGRQWHCCHPPHRTQHVRPHPPRSALSPTETVCTRASRAKDTPRWPVTYQCFCHLFRPISFIFLKRKETRGHSQTSLTAMGTACHLRTLNLSPRAAGADRRGTRLLLLLQQPHMQTARMSPAVTVSTALQLGEGHL